MALPPLPLLLYAEPIWAPSPWRVAMYLHEKKLSPDVVQVVPMMEESVLKRYPPMPGSAVPQLAIPKQNATTSKTDPDSFHWLPQSLAILEYLEDLCDAHPELSSVGSLRGGSDLFRRAAIRADLQYGEGIWCNAGATLLLGSKTYNEFAKQDTIHLPSAHAIADHTRKTVLDKLEELLPLACDYVGLEQDEEGAATIADIALYAQLEFYRQSHGCDICQGYPDMERFVAAFSKRKSSKVGLPDELFPAWATSFRDGFEEAVWPKAVFN